jgi:hypothetical protein
LLIREYVCREYFSNPIWLDQIFKQIAYIHLIIEYIYIH